MKIRTAAGPASAELDAATDPPFLLVLTHGAGGGTDSADLLAARQAGLYQGAAVARVVQPYRLRGARAPGSATRQDAAWLEIIGKLRRRFPGVPLIQGGRSNGARVACRTAREAGALAVLALAFPLHPPGRPDRSRAAELAAAGTEVLVVNGASDPFGVPEAAGAIRVVVLPGAAHALAGQGGAIRRVVGSWLATVLARGSARLPGGKPPDPRPGTPRWPTARFLRHRAGAGPVTGSSAYLRAAVRCGSMISPPGSSSPVSSKITIPLQSSVQPCSGWLATARAASRSVACGSGH